MGALVNARRTTVAASVVAAAIIALNVFLLFKTFVGSASPASGPARWSWPTTSTGSSRRCRRTGRHSSSTSGIADEDRYIDAATLLTVINAMPYSKHDWHFRLRVPTTSGTRRRCPTVHGALSCSTARGSAASCRARGARRPRRGDADVGPAGVGAPGVPPPPRPVGVARVALLCPDLLFGSKLQQRARAGRPRGGRAGLAGRRPRGRPDRATSTSGSPRRPAAGRAHARLLRARRAGRPTPRRGGGHRPGRAALADGARGSRARRGSPGVKLALVTGASSGIGARHGRAARPRRLARAARCPARGPPRVVGGRDRATRGRAAGPDRRGRARRALREAVDEEGALHLLVNNAGSAWRSSFADGGADNVLRTMELNFDSVRAHHRGPAARPARVGARARSSTCPRRRAGSPCRSRARTPPPSSRSPAGPRRSASRRPAMACTWGSCCRASCPPRASPRSTLTAADALGVRARWARRRAAGGERSSRLGAIVAAGPGRGKAERYVAAAATGWRRDRRAMAALAARGRSGAGRGSAGT